MDAVHFVQTIERRQGSKIACIEEVAYQKGLITAEQLLTLAEPFGDNGYGRYLKSVAETGI